MTGTKTITTEPSQSAAAIRIRDNQRRSRARRKEYVENLERKVQEYERQGVDATLEMQHAARTVALENSRLRVMLARMGASETDIEAFLQSCQDREAAEALSSVSTQPLHRGGQLESEPATKHARGSQPGERFDLDASKMNPRFSKIMASLSSTVDEGDIHGERADYPLRMLRTVKYQQQQSRPRMLCASHAHDSPLDVLASATLQQGSCCENRSQSTAAAASEAPSPSTVEPSTGAVTPSSAFAPELSPDASTVVQDCSSPPMDMSCDAAAAIIAKMQGHGDREFAKARLGCRDQKPSSLVNNPLMVQILGRGDRHGQYA